MTEARTVAEKLRDLWTSGRDVHPYSEPFATDNGCQDRVVMTGSSTWKASELLSDHCHVFIDREEDMGDNIFFSDIIDLQSFPLTSDGCYECLEAFIATCRTISAPYIGSLGLDTQDIDDYLKSAIRLASD